MTEQQALAKTYTDSCTVFRRVSKKNSDTKQTEQQEEKVLEGLHCALSLDNGGALSLGGTHGKSAGSYTLFCAPETNIQKGDRLEVTAAGQKYVLWAGRPFSYAGSHMETPLSQEER